MTIADPYAAGALSKEHHERLVANLDNYARDAGIQAHWICNPLPDDLTKAERNYLVKIRFHMASHGEVSGLCLTQKAHIKSIDQRMAAYAGCLVRNFIRARVMTLGSVLDGIAGQTLPDYTCLLIPNFFLPAAEGGHIAKWQLSALYDLLMARQLAGRQTVIYVSDLDALGREYGTMMRDLIDRHYVKIGG